MLLATATATATATAMLMAAAADSKSLPAAPIGNSGEWITSEDYPPEALRDRAEGTTAILFEIAIDGTVGNCVVVGSSGSPLLDATACAVFSARAKYHPSTDEDGKPIVSSGTRRIVWHVPGPPTEGYPINPGHQSIQFEVSETGAVENCKVTTSPAISPAIASQTQKICDRYSSQRIRIFRKPDGTPIRKTVIMSQQIEIKDGGDTAKQP